MASKVLKSFLIGIGYDTKALEEGDKKINASLNGIKSGALSVSAALVGAFGATAGAVVGMANRVDELALSSQNLRTSINTVNSFGGAIRLMGGDAADAVETLRGFEEIQNNLRLKGDAGPINELATAGVDVNTLYKTQTGEEFMRELSRQLPNLNEGQRAQVQSSLGLSDAVFRSLAGGVEKLDETMKRASALTGSVDQLTEDSRKLAENASEFGLIIEGINNELADKFLPSLVGAGSAINDFLKDQRGKISEAIDYAADNSGVTASLGVSSAAALAGAAAAKMGLKTIGGAASKGGTAGLAVTGSAIGANLLNRTLDEYVPGYEEVSRGFDDLLKSITGLERIQGPMELMFGGDPGTQSITPTASVSENPIESMFDRMLGVERAPASVEAGSGRVIRTQEDIDYLNHRDRSVVDSMPPISVSTPEEDRRASAEALAGALSRAPIKVENQLGVTLQLDGQALESKIVQVSERQNHEALNDFTATTER